MFDTPMGLQKERLQTTRFFLQLLDSFCGILGKQHVFLTSYWTAHVEFSVVDSYFFIDCTDPYIYGPGEMRKALTMEEQINQVKSINQ